MKNYLFLLFFYSALIFSQKTESRKLNKQEIAQKQIENPSGFPIYKAYELKDKNGISNIVLCENQKVISKEDTLNTKIQANFITIENGQSRIKWTINDLLEDYIPKETTIWFWTKYCSFKDLDGDGYIDPVIVYGTRTEYDEVRRVKIITVYKDKKYVIRAVECDLDDCRSFKKDSNWNSLPQKIKTYTDQLVIKLRKEQNLLLKDR